MGSCRAGSSSTLVALPPRRRRVRAGRRGAGARRRHRSRARRGGRVPRARGQPSHAVGHLVRDREPARDDARVPRAVREPPRSAVSPTTRSDCWPKHSAPTAPPGVDDPWSSCSRRASTTRRTSSTRSSLDRWVSSSSRAATSCAATTSSTCARRAASSASTSCTAASTTTTSTRCTSAPTRCSAARESSNAARAGNVDDRQRTRQRRRRRQGHLPVRARDDRVLPRRGADPRQRRDVPTRRHRAVRVGARSRSTELVFKPVDGSGGYGLVIGPAASEADLDRRCGQGARRSARVDRAGAGRAVDRADVRRRQDGRAPPRPAAVRGERRPRRLGGAGRPHAGRACPSGSLVVNSSQGGGSKDTWVLAAAGDGREASPTPFKGGESRPAKAPAARPVPGPRRPQAATAAATAAVTAFASSSAAGRLSC